jgi:hypothetical protein
MHSKQFALGLFISTAISTGGQAQPIGGNPQDHCTALKSTRVPFQIVLEHRQGNKTSYFASQQYRGNSGISTNYNGPRRPDGEPAPEAPYGVARVVAQNGFTVETSTAGSTIFKFEYHGFDVKTFRPDTKRLEYEVIFNNLRDHRVTTSKAVREVVGRSSFVVGDCTFETISVRTSEQGSDGTTKLVTAEESPELGTRLRETSETRQGDRILMSYTASVTRIDTQFSPLREPPRAGIRAAAPR